MKGIFLSFLILGLCLAVTARAVLFGGLGSGFFADTWIFDLNDSSWMEDGDSITPSPRYYHTFCETSLDGSSYLALFAGFFDIDDTWAFGGGDYIAFPPEAVEDLTASLAGDALHLIWSNVTADTRGNPIVADRYILYRGGQPDFEPSPGDSLAVTPGPVFTDNAAAVGDTAVDHFYLVRAVHTSGRRSAGSNRAGEFDRTIGNGG